MIVRECTVLSVESLPSVNPYEVVVPYRISDVAGFEVVHVIVALEVETVVATLEMTGADGGTCTASVVNCCGEPYAVSPDEVFEMAR